MSGVKKISCYSLFTAMTCFFSLHANIEFADQGGRFVVAGGSLHIASPIKNWAGTLSLLSGSVTGNSITLNDGGIKTAKGFLETTGEVTPALVPSVTLRDGNRLVGYPGVLIDSLDIRGAGNILSGQPDLQSPSSLANSLAELQINIANRLSQSFTLNNGTIKLLNDLTLADDVTFSGSGTIDLNGRRLNLPGKVSTWTNDLVLYNPTDIALNAKTILSGKWTFSGLNGILQGNGNVLDLTSGGTLQIAADQEVEFTNVHIRGLGEIYGSLIFDNTSARIRLSNCSLQISTSYTLANGGMIFDGGNSSIVTGTDTLYLAPNFGLTVDHVTVLGDALSATATVNLFPNIPDGVRLTYLNNGILRSMASGEELTVLTENNSWAIANLDERIIDNSWAVVHLEEIIVDNSWAIQNLDERVISNSWAIENLDERVIENSWSIVNIDQRVIENSWAIVNVDQRVIENSWAIVSIDELATDNSTAIVGWIKDTSVVVAGGGSALAVENSNAIVNWILNTSNAMVSVQALVDNNSWAIENLDERVTANSWSIVNIDERVLENSWSIINIDERVIANSNAVVTNDNLAEDNSNAIVGWIKNTSDAMVSVQALVDENSWAIVSVDELAADNSTALTGWVQDTSDIVSSGASSLAVENSNAIVGWIKNTSDAMVSVQALVDDNSWAIENLEERVTANSWSIENLDERIVANSWAIENLDERVTSNSWAIENLDERLTANSWSIVNIDERVLENSWSIINIDERVIANSNAVVTNDNLAEDNSNAIVGWIKNTSDAMVSVQALVDENSWAIVSVDELAADNSTALTGWVQDTSDIVSSGASSLAVENSNAIVGWILGTSNAVASLGSGSVPDLSAALATIDHGPAHIHMSLSTTMSFNVYLSENHMFKIHANGILDGEGHFINFASKDTVMMELDPGVTVTFVNVELFNYADSKILFGAGSDIIFGSGCIVHVHANQEISRLWKIAGYASIYGGGNELIILNDASGIEVGVASECALHDVRLSGVSGTRIRCMTNGSRLVLDNAHIALSNNYSFTMGSMSFYRDVTWASTMVWSYQSAVGSTVNSGARLIFDRGLFWNYDPISTNKFGLIFTDSSAQWLMNGNTLSISSTGIQLTRGRWIMDDANVLIGSGLTLSEAIILGNGIASDDVILELLPAAEIILLSGVIDYQNVS